MRRATQVAPGRLGRNRLAKAVPNDAPSWALGFGAAARGVDATTGSSKVISTDVTEAGAWDAATCVRSFDDKLGARPHT